MTLKEINNNIWAYDIEVYNRYYCFHFYNGSEWKSVSGYKGTLEETRDNQEKLLEIVKVSFLVGHNNYHYDDKILYKFITSNCENGVEYLKEINDDITIRQKSFTSRLKSLDCSQEWKDSRFKDPETGKWVSYPISLKKTEAFQGKNIEETPIDFTIMRELTEKEREEVDYYCKYDVEQTYENYYSTEVQNYFSMKLLIINKFYKDKDFWEIVKERSTKYVEQVFNLRKLLAPAPGFITQLDVPEDIQKIWFLAFVKNKGFAKNESDAKKDGTYYIEPVNEFDNTIKFGGGGLHAVSNVSQKFETEPLEEMAYIDVASMYPNLIINTNILGDKTQLYMDLIKERLSYKGVDNDYSDALKLFLNKLYGTLGMYSKKNLKRITYLGQTNIYNLAQSCYGIGCEIIQVNTDSVLVKYKKHLTDELNNVIINWEQDTCLNLEAERIAKIHQLNVNNYIVKKPQEDIDDGFKLSIPYTKFKYGEVKTHGDLRKPYKSNIVDDRSLAIVWLAIGEYLINGTAMSTTIYKNKHDLILYQYITTVGKTFSHTEDSDGKVLHSHVNRLFFVEYGKDYSKVKVDENGEKTYSRFPNTPEMGSQIHNGDISEFDGVLNLGYYLELAQEKLQKMMR